MSYSCTIHGWNHIYKMCPACYRPTIVTSGSLPPSSIDKVSWVKTEIKTDPEIIEKLDKILKILERAGFYVPSGG